MDLSVILDVYLANVRLGIKKLGKETFSEDDIRTVVNSEYHKMRDNFDKELLPKLTENEIEVFFENLNSKTEELIELFTSNK